MAQITLLDADFDVMPRIVLEGRRVINNITRAASLFLVKNIFSLILSVLLLIFPFAYPFSAHPAYSGQLPHHRFALLCAGAAAPAGTG